MDEPGRHAKGRAFEEVGAGVEVGIHPTMDLVVALASCDNVWLGLGAVPVPVRLMPSRGVLLIARTGRP